MDSCRACMFSCLVLVYIISKNLSSIALIFFHLLLLFILFFMFHPLDELCCTFYSLNLIFLKNLLCLVYIKVSLIWSLSFKKTFKRHRISQICQQLYILMYCVVCSQGFNGKWQSSRLVRSITDYTFQRSMLDLAVSHELC